MKEHTPPYQYLLIHTAVGLTILAMMILSLINRKWRKKYCVYFFIFAIVEGLHALPASLVQDSQGLIIFFTILCMALIGVGGWGLYTNKTYDQDPTKAAKNLDIQYSIITFINALATIVELLIIFQSFKAKNANGGVFVDYGDEPHPIFGHTLYDLIPLGVGKAIFYGFVISVWFIWPLYLLNIHQPQYSLIKH